jgi:hypothetical protein
MTMRPGFPERTGFEDRFQAIEKAIRDLQQSSPGGLSGDGKNTYLRQGSFILSEDGAFQIVDDGGLLLAEFDKNAVTFFDSSGDPLAVLDRDGVAVGEAPVLLTSTGLTVGTDVEIDATGLQVVGGFVTPIDGRRGADLATNVSLTSTDQTVASVQINPADWVETMFIMANATGSLSNTAGGSRNLLITLSVDGSAYGPITGTAADGTTIAIPINNSQVKTPPSDPFTVALQARLSSGTNNANSFRVDVLAFGFRL